MALLLAGTVGATLATVTMIITLALLQHLAPGWGHTAHVLVMSLVIVAVCAVTGWVAWPVLDRWVRSRES